MIFRIAVGTLLVGALALGAGAASANEAKAGSGSSVTHETGYVTTQARRGRGRGPVVVAPRRRNNTGRNVAIGVGAAILGGIIANEAARANSSGSGNSCRRWAYQCDNGAGWACRNFNRYC